MFDEMENPIPLLAVLERCRRWQDYTGSPPRMTLDADTVYDCLFEMLESFQIYDFSCDDYGSEHLALHAGCIRDFYRLCHLFGRQRHIRFRDNPYVTRAQYCFRNLTAGFAQWGGTQWILQSKNQRRRPIGLYVWYDLNYIDSLDIHLIVLDILFWFTEQLKELRTTLERG